MNLKRIISALIGFPIVVLLLIFGNTYVIDAVIAVLALISMYEYTKCFKSTKKANPISWVGYIVCLIIPFLHIISNEYLIYVITLTIPLVIFVLFLHIIISNLKITIKDVSITLFGIVYIVVFYAFLAKIFGMNNGKIYIWYTVLAAWGTDIFAYSVGRRFGKHKFSKISPNKSIEGCIAGTIGAMIVSLLYTLLINNCFNYTINYIIIAIISIVLSIISQVGDFSASSLKRYAGVKDFGNIIPGHGGILDRCDSLMFIAPFAYFLFMLI